MTKNIFTFFLLFMFWSCSKDAVTTQNNVYDVTDSFVHNAKVRTYRVHLPASYYNSSNKLPMVLALHGGYGSGAQFESETGLSNKADMEGFIIVYPDGLENPGTTVRSWNAGKCCGQNASSLNTDDVGFISKLIDKLSTDYRVDQKKIYAAGHSNGAMLCYRLASELSTKLAAIAVNAGNFQMKSPYAPVRNVPVIHINSKLDDNVIYAGGMTNGPGGQYNPPVDSCLNIVAGLSNCTQAKQIVQSATLYTEYRWSGCTPNNFQVVLYLTEDGGHSWPGVGANGSKAFANNDIIWDFLKLYSLP